MPARPGVRRWPPAAPDRTPPTTTDTQARDAFPELSGYRDGAIFVGHWAGTSEWLSVTPQPTDHRTDAPG